MRIGNTKVDRTHEADRRWRQMQRFTFTAGVKLRPTNCGVERRAIDETRRPSHQQQHPPRERAGGTIKSRRARGPEMSSPSTPIPHARAHPSANDWQARHERTVFGPPTNRRRLNFYGHFKNATTVRLPKGRIKRRGRRRPAAFQATA